MKVLVAQLCPILCDSTNCSLAGSSFHGILQARILEWVTIPFSRGSSWPKDRTQFSCIGRQILYSLSHEASYLAILQYKIKSLSNSNKTLVGEGNGNPLQCSCLENPRDGGAWWAAVCGVAQSQTRPKRLSSSSSHLSHGIVWVWWLFGLFL